MPTRPFALIAVVVLPLELIAQSPPRRPLSIRGGFGLQYGDPDFGLGWSFGGRFRAYTDSWLSLRLDFAYESFGRPERFTETPNTPCPPERLCGSVATGDRIKVLSGGAHLALLRHSAFAWTAGTGIYHFLETPNDGSYTRAGWNLGFTTSMERSAYFDMRYHGLIGPRKSTRGFTTVSLGIRL